MLQGKLHDGRVERGVGIVLDFPRKLVEEEAVVELGVLQADALRGDGNGDDLGFGRIRIISAAFKDKRGDAE